VRRHVTVPGGWSSRAHQGEVVDCQSKPPCSKHRADRPRFPGNQSTATPFPTALSTTNPISLGSMENPVPESRTISFLLDHHRSGEVRCLARDTGGEMGSDRPTALLRLDEPTANAMQRLQSLALLCHQASWSPQSRVVDNYSWPYRRKREPRLG
jgi:hypothetical protein